MTAYASGDIVTTHTHMRRVHPRTAPLRSAGALLLTGSFFLAACGSAEKSPEAKPPATSTPSATSTPAKPLEDPVETAKKEATVTYLAHWKEVEKRYADKTGKAGNLKRYAASAALAQVETGAADMRKKDAVVLGTVTVNNPTATSADIDRKVPNVILSSCLDISQWTVTDVDTQKPVAMPKNRLVRYVIKATLEKWPEGWRVIRDEPQGKAC
ncbi:hypothetical protein [Streptomyces gardneri]|uniref:Secreted protein/lipoprotein n=1 Tax=Streptomyces gardneri TaxID=66892 RepID=A0A4Y3RL05_9ACTN|nr:hypothetical protein [Streptomyces gardneri]GEB57397.1 hypothetical protein SGA01_30020 [Streptomyces gardneri]GHH12814.1 hypothetical protein GCM10017674_59210 [Streptomyces gardneri]